MGKNKKDFWDERSRKIGRKKKRIKHYRSGKTAVPNNGRVTENQCEPDFLCEAPSCFSFTYNLDETARFFSKMMRYFKNGALESIFFIDSRYVTVVTTDVIMYLIAIMRNYKLAKKRLYSFYGTYPDDGLAKKVYYESGLLKFVKSKSKELPPNTEKISIMAGKSNDSRAAGKMCDFVAKKFDLQRGRTSELYNVIIEMMSNVYYHAYDPKEEIMKAEWYMYAEHVDDEIKFVFLDTGLGIGKTVKKHSLYEKVTSKIGIGSESRLIKSALDGDFRTQTQKHNHGKGLPSINEFAYNSQIKDFHIISGGGHCWLESVTDDFKCEDLKNRINGTIYCFTIKR